MCPRWSYVPKIRGILFFHPQDRTMERGATDLLACVQRTKFLRGREKAGEEGVFFGRGSVAPSTRSASQTAIEPIVSVNILISHIPPCIAPYTLISRTPPPPTPVGGITPNSSQIIVRLVVNQPEPTRSIRVLRSRLLFERNTDS